ncbi:MAG TPA: metallophosphoesterase [Trueperaceae bacterium]|nr:metallophosphoesterase [Trueperaceae bacterium]
MIKVIAVGDVHGQWPELWRVLKAAAACTPALEPTAPVIEGRYQVVCVGDLVHYKDERAYAVAVGEEPYDPANPDHLRRAAKAQIRELYRFKRFVDAAEGNVTVILGNHDESALDHRYELSTRGGLKHIEFDEQQGGMALPDDLAAWFHAMPRERVFHGVQFAHAGPLPGMQVFDDFFYHDPDTKSWWYKKPELVRQAGHRFGVYGHTVMKEGVYVDRDNCFAMIDALGKLQFLELILDVDRLDYSVMQL